jgi:copper chaperone NosL
MPHSSSAPSLATAAAAVSPPAAAHAPARPRRRTLPLVLAAAALGTIVASYAQPFWTFKLYAPQYPHGLTLTISLTGFAGDVREIDMLNHYIGMGSLAHGAAFEREYGGYALLLLGAAVALLVRLRSWKGTAAAAVLGLSYPLVFLADTFFWLHRFGHRLDPRAPLHIPAFTPQLFGNGNIGQFMTFAAAERGFGLSVAAALLLASAALLRWREERSCCPD